MTSDNTQTRAMAATDFRRELTKVLGTLDDGPVQITDYGEVVAEIRGATPDQERAYTERWFALWEALQERRLLSVRFSNLRTYDDLQELVEAFNRATEEGTKLTYADLYEYQGLFTPAEILAKIYFAGQPPEENPVEWFEACCEIQKYARSKEARPDFPDPQELEDDGEAGGTFISVVQEFGHTPQTLIQFCTQAIDQGVPLDEVIKLMGSDAIPADVLAMKEYNSYRFENLTGAGLPRVEAIAVFRRGLDTHTAGQFTRAGVQTAQEIELLIDLGFNEELAVRAAKDGMSPEQWRKILPQVQKLQYEEKGLLPFSLIAEATAEGVSLVRWDKNAAMSEPYRKSVMYHPWSLVYPDGVLALARERIAPTYVKDYAELLYYHYKAVDNEGFLDDLIGLRKAGLTSDLLKALQKISRPPAEVFGPREVHGLLEAGITTLRAKQIADVSTDKEIWLATLQDWEAYHPYVTQFIEAKKNTQGWQDVRAVADHYRASRKVDRYRKYEFQAMGIEGITLLDTPEKLLRVHILELLSSAVWMLKDEDSARFRRRQGKPELLDGRTDAAVKTLQKEFNALILNVSTPAVQDEEHRVEQIDEGREVGTGQPQIEA